MISIKELLEYKELLQGAEARKRSLDKVNSLRTLKEIMREDQKKKLIKLGVSSNWVLWWWDATKMVYEKGDWKEDPIFGYTMVDAVGDVEVDQLRSIYGVGQWIDYYMQTEPMALDESIGQGSDWYDTKYPGEGKILDGKYYLQPDEVKPEVTPLDVMFCELLETLDKQMERYSRKAAVDGFVKSPEDAIPSSALRGGTFFGTIANIIDGKGETDDKVPLVLCETLTSTYDGKKLLKVYKNLTDKKYLYSTEDAWLYVWGVKVHPTNKTEIKAPTELPRWSAMQGKKTAIGDMIRTLIATDCGKPWKKTARLFIYSDGSQPVEAYLKNYGLQGSSKTEFLKLVVVH